MQEKKKEVRSQWLHIRLNEGEYSSIRQYWQQTTIRELSHYARTVLLKKPVTINYRNQSADEILAEMIRLKNELQAISKNLHQAVLQLQNLDKIAQVPLWVMVHENLRITLLQKSEEINARMVQIYEQWSSK